MLNILMVGDVDARLTQLKQIMTLAGHHVEVIRSDAIVQLDTLIPLIRPNLVLIDYSDPLRDSLEQFCFHSHQHDATLLVLGSTIDTALSTQLRTAGLAVYADPSSDIQSFLSLMPVLSLMLEREQKLQQEVDGLKQELADRKDIERAKEYLSIYMNITAEQAYQNMRKQAMQQRRTMGDLARALLKHKNDLGHDIKKA